MHTKTVLLLTAFVASAVAGPLSSRGSCSRHCTESSKLKYEPGKTYTYDYSADTTTTMMGTMDEESKLHIKSSVLITAHTKCDMSMQLRDVSLEEYDPKSSNRKASINTERFSNDLQQNSLRFSFQDGQVEDICPSKLESSWVLNVKRGILTIFQNSMKDLERGETLEEIDVAGKCPVTYEFLGKSWGTTSVKKSKDFVQCTERQSTETSVQSASYEHTSEIKSSPLIKGTQECTQSFSAQKLQKSRCEEHLIFRPFSNKKSGAVTKAVQTLTFNNEKKSSFAGDDYEAIRTGLIFNHELESNDEKRKYRDAEQALIELCKKSVDDIKKEVPHLFNQYVYTLKHLKHPELEAIYRRSKEICRFNLKAEKYFTDALPSVGTDASVRMMIELVDTEKVSDAEADYWYTSFAFIARPDINMFRHVASALKKPTQQAILGISSMINTYCTSRDPKCEHEPAIRMIITKLTNMLNKDCSASNEDESRKILLALKGIGNAGRSSKATDILSRCAKNIKTSNEIRVAAIEAFRRQSCTASRRSLMNLFRDLQEDTEVRIASYLALMKCPDASIIQNVKDVLNIEEVNQVGSFVWTHLTNMQETTDPCKRDIKNLLRNMFLEKKFSSDARKFSRAFEKSIYSEKLNSGIHFDGNVMFTPKSYLPRSAMFNLTMDLFGESLNLFEIGGKVEGFEHLVESFFGPNGFFPDKNIKEFLKNSRTKRSVYDNKIDEFKKLFKAQSHNFDKPEGSMYLKMFGNELMFGNFKGLDSIMSYTEKQIDWVKILEDLAKNRDVEFTKSMMFLDTTYTIPTSAGLPLHLSVNGSSTMNLKMGGKLDIRNFLKKEIDINGHIKPSGAVEISAVMSVDAYYARTGLKMVATMHSSTSLDGKIQMKNGKLLKTVVNVPSDKIEIFDVQTNMFLIHENLEYPQQGIDSERTEIHECTGKTISAITGMKLCGEIQYPNASLKYDSPYFPMTGPTKFSIYIQKTDKKMMSYKFDSTYENTEDKKAALLSFDTPGSDIDREMTVEISMNKKDQNFALRLRTPMKKMGLSGELLNKEDRKKAELLFTIDDIEKLALVADLNIQKRSESARYTPKIEIRIPGKKTVKLSGYGFVQPEKRYIVDINLDNLAKDTLEFKVDVNKQGKERYAVDARLTSYMLAAKIRGNVLTRQRGTTTNMDIDYSAFQGKYEKLKIGTKFQDLSASSLTKLKIMLSLDMSAAPDYNTQLNWETQMAKGHVENTLKVSQGIRGKSKIDFFIQEIVSYAFLPGKTAVYTNFKIKIPIKKINYVWYMKHQKTASYVKSRVFVQYASRRRIDLQAQAVSIREKMNGELKLAYPGREMNLEGKVTKVGDNRYDAFVTAQWQKGKKITANAEYMNKSKGKQLHHTLEADVTLPDKTVKYNGELKLNDKIYMTKHKMSYSKEVYMLKADYYISQRKFSSVLFLNGKSYTSEAYVTKGATSRKAVFDAKFDTYRRIKGMMSFDSEDGSRYNYLVAKFNTYWNADKDTSERIGFDFNFNPADNSAMVSLYYPDRTLTASMKPKLDIADGDMDAHLLTEFSWASDKKVNFNMTLTSKDYGLDVTATVEGRAPFTGYREMSLKHVHQSRQQSFSSQTSGTLNRNKNANLEMSGSYLKGRSSVVKAGAKFSSTFEDYESISGEIEHAYSPSQFRSNATLSWGTDKEIGFSLNGLDSSNRQTTNMQGQLYLTSPFEHYERLSGGFNHYFAPTQVRSTGNLKWAEDREFSINFGGSGTKDRNNQICKTAVRISTPIEGFENVVSNLQYENDGKEMVTKGDITWAYKKITFGFDKSKNGGDIAGSLFFTSPFEGYKSLKASGEHKRQKISFRNKFEIHLNEDKYKLKSSGKMRSEDNLEAKLEVATPIEGFQTVEAKFKHKMTKKASECNLEVILNEKKSTVDLTTEYTGGDRKSFEWELKCNSPLIDNQELVISGMHKSQRGKIINNLKGTQKGERAILQHNLQYTSMQNFHNKIQLSHPWSEKYAEFKLENRLIVQNHDFTTKHSLVVDNSKFWDVQAQHKMDDTNRTADLSINDHAGKIFSVIGVHSFNSIRKSPVLTLAWRRESKIENLRLNPTWNFDTTKGYGDGELRITSSISGYETLVAEVEYDFRDYPKNVQVVLSKNDKTVSLIGKADTKKKTGILTFTSPFENYEKITLEGNYVDEKRKNGKMSLEWSPSKKVELSASLLRDDDSAVTSIKFSSPFESYESLVFSGEYDISKKKKSAEMSLEYAANKIITLKGHVKIQKGKGNGKITFTSPIENFSSTSFQVNYDVSKNLKKASIAYECPSKHKLSVDGQIDLAEKIKSAKLTLKTPFEKMNSIVLSSNLDSTNKLKTGYLKCVYNDEKSVKLNGNFQMESERSVNGELHFTSPFKNFENIKYDIKLQKFNKAYQGSSSFSWSMDKKMTTDVTIKMEPFDVTIKADSPFDPVKNVIMRTVFANNKTMDVEFASSLEWKNINKIDLMFRNEIVSDNEFRTKLTLTTPFEGFDELQMRSSWMMTDHVIAAGFSLTSPFKALPSLEISSTYKIGGDGKIKAKFQVDTDKTLFKATGSREDNVIKFFLNASSVLKNPLTVDITLDPDDMNVIKFSNGYNLYTIRYSSVFGEENKKLSTEVKIPTLTYNYRVMSLDLAFTNRQNKFVDVLVKFATIENTHKVATTYTQGNKLLKGKLVLSSPLLKMQNLTLTGDVEYDNEKKMNLYLKAPSTVYSIVGVLGDHSKNNVSGFVSLNTPADVYGTIRLDAKFSNNEWKNTEGMLKVETSNKNFRSARIEGKFNDYESHKVMSLILNTPFENYEEITAEGKITHDEEWKSIKPTIKLTLPGSEMSAHGEYEDTYDHHKAILGFSKGRSKPYEVSAQIQKRDYEITLSGKRPSDYTVKSYRAQMKYKNQRGRHTFDASLSLPDNERAAINGVFNYNDWKAFNGRVSFTSTFDKYESLSTTVHHSLGLMKKSFLLQTSWSPSDIAKIEIKSSEDGSGDTKSIEIFTPWKHVKDISASYDFSHKSGRKTRDLEVKYLGNIVAHITATSDVEGVDQTQTIALELPSLTLKGSSKFKIGKQTEMSFKVDIPSRIVFFHTLYAPTSRGFKHLTEVAWDQRESKKALYEVIFVDKSRSQLSTGDLTIRLVHPIRSFEVKFNHECTDRDSTLTTKFMWDPLRDRKKQMTVVTEVHDKSVYGKSSYDGAITLKTPQLHRDVKLLGLVEFSKLNREMFKTNWKLDYSNNRRKAMEFELKLTDDTRGRGREGIMYSIRSRLIQPQSVTYFNTFSTIVITPNTKKIDSRFSYVNSESKKKSYLARSVINRKKLTVQFSSPSKSVKMIGNVQSHSADFDVTVNKNKVFLAQCNYEWKDALIANADVIYYPTNDGLKFQAVSGDSVSVELTHKNEGKDFSDFLFTVGLRNPRILNSQVNWRTTMLSELKNGVVSMYSTQKDVLDTGLEDLKEKIDAELKYKTAAIQRVNSVELKPLIDTWEAMENDLLYDYVVLKKQVTNMYENNEFYIQDIIAATKSASKYINERGRVIMKKIGETLNNFKGCFIKSIKAVIAFIGRLVSSTLQSVVECCNMIKNFIMDACFVVVKKVEWMLYKVAFFIQNCLCSVRVWLNEKANKILENVIYFVNKYIPFIKTIESYIEKVIECKNSMMLKFYNSKVYKIASKYYSLVRNFVESVRAIEYTELMKGHYNKASKHFLNAYNKVQSSVDVMYTAISEHPHVAFAGKIANHGYQKVAWAYRYWAVDEFLDSIYQDWHKIFYAIVKDVAHDATSKYTAFVRDSKLVYKPKEGKIEVDLRIPSDRKNLWDIFDIYSSPEYKKIMAFKEKYFPENRMTFWDYWHMYKPYSDVNNWIPPFKSQALIAGRQHYMTFDKLFYDFAGRCSYLLAHDMIDGNFTIIAKYEKDYSNVPKKSIIVRTDDRTIEITRNFKILIDDEKIDLPYQFDNTMITRFDDVITLSNKNGLTVRCNLFRDVCTVDMSGWYFAKTGGLFGVYDNEPKLDLQKSDGEITKSIDDFSHSWSVGSGHCTAGNYAAKTDFADVEARKVCEETFMSEYSPLRPCFKMVLTEEFMEMCLIDATNRENSEDNLDEAICTSAYAYKRRCLAEEVAVTLPSSCGRCAGLDNKKMDEGDSFTIDSSNKPSAADIVFIVEENKCNKDKFAKLEEISQGIERSLREKGIRKATYTVVGFGGDGVHEKPHVHWAESEQSGNYRSVANAFRSLTVGNGKSDIYKAILFATNLRFTPGAAKTFVLVKCSSCNGGSIKENYSDVLWMLLNHDISLHVLMDKDFKLRSGSRKSGGILGMDKLEAFTTKDVRDKMLKGDTTLRDQLYDVKDLCIPLALESNGTMFNSRKLIDKRRSVQKNFIHVFSRRLVQTTEAPNCQLCFCHSHEESSGKVECSACISAFDKGILTPNLPDLSSWPGLTSMIKTKTK